MGTTTLKKIRRSAADARTAAEPTPIFDELAPVFDVPEFGAEPAPLPSFADAVPGEPV